MTSYVLITMTCFEKIVTRNSPVIHKIKIECKTNTFTTIFEVGPLCLMYERTSTGQLTLMFLFIVKTII